MKWRDMLPISLTMHNFLPYRAPDAVRFEGIHLACLTGANGAGKSSLLDAITWAIWGKSRARRDDDLVHMGQGEMYVQLDFEQESIRYRVLRRRNAGKRGQGTLDLFVFDSDGQPQTITEPSIRATQTRINALLRLDYETFVHSSFLQQGKADAFTTRTPAERKRILGEILGLERWATYEEAVKERLKEIGNNLHLYQTRIDEIERELARRPALEDELQSAQANHAQAQEALSAAEARLKEVESAPTDLKHARAGRESLAARLREIERDIESVSENIESTAAQIETYRQIIESADEIEAGYAALQSARQTDAHLADTLRRLTPLNDERNRLTGQIDSARARLESERDALIRRRDELRAQLDADPTDEIESVQAEVTELQALDAERVRLQETMTANREARADALARLKTVEAEGLSLREQLQKLSEAPPEYAICPTCGQSLSPERRQTVMADLEAGIEERREQYKEIGATIKDYDAALAQDGATHKAQQTELKRLSPLSQRLGTLQQQADDRADAEARLDAVADEIAALDDQLSAEAYADDLRERLDAIERERAALGYDDSAAQDARDTIDAHLGYEEQHTRLTVARESLPGYQNQLEGYQRHLANLNTTRAEKREEAAAMDETITRLEVLVAEFQRREQDVLTHRTTERNLYERVTNCRQELGSLDKQAERQADFIARRDSARADEALHNQLRAAFGKNGVPAMMIESAIPELEQTANALLSKMTDGRMHLRLNTQREKVTGGQMETLEIAIADELGERSYELYSGGEAFRINFAIRVALSQMLARRAGAHLRTLFIDEGFGTQDDNGRDKLIEAINAIQDEFDMVLVITHIHELRDNFPVHIEVEKTANGSRIIVR